MASCQLCTPAAYAQPTRVHRRPPLLRVHCSSLLLHHFAAVLQAALPWHLTALAPTPTLSPQAAGRRKHKQPTIHKRAHRSGRVSVQVSPPPLLKPPPLAAALGRPASHLCCRRPRQNEARLYRCANLQSSSRNAFTCRAVRPARRLATHPLRMWCWRRSRVLCRCSPRAAPNPPQHLSPHAAVHDIINLFLLPIIGAMTVAGLTGHLDPAYVTYVFLAYIVADFVWVAIQASLSAQHPPIMRSCRNLLQLPTCRSAVLRSASQQRRSGAALSRQPAVSCSPRFLPLQPSLLRPAPFAA